MAQTPQLAAPRVSGFIGHPSVTAKGASRLLFPALERVLEGSDGVGELSVRQLLLRCRNELRVRLRLHRLRRSVQTHPAQETRRALHVNPGDCRHDPERQGREGKREHAPAVSAEGRHS
jgi:hypothetical protein